MFKEEDTNDDLSDLNSQLYAAARTNELLASLRLLAQGKISPAGFARVNTYVFRCAARLDKRRKVK